MIIWQLKRLIYRMAVYYQTWIKPQINLPVSKYLYNDDPHIHNAKALGDTIKKLREYRRTMGFSNLMKKYDKENQKEKIKMNMYSSANPYGRGLGYVSIGGIL